MSLRNCAISKRNRWLSPRIAQFLGWLAIRGQTLQFSQGIMFDCISQFLSWEGCLDGFAQYFLAVGVVVPEWLHNFWAKQLTAAQNCAISGLSSLIGLDCAVFLVKVDRQDCTILEPSRLPVRIMQFLGERLVTLQNCIISWGSCSACSWTKFGEISFERNATRYYAHANNLLENHWILCTW